MKQHLVVWLLLVLCLDIRTVSSAAQSLPPTTGKFFFLDVEQVDDQRLITLYKKDGTNAFAAHPSTGQGGFYSALY
jgi:hypothetical protein